MKKRTDSFSATGNDGLQYTVYIYTDFINAGSFEDPNAIVKGIKELRTSDGMLVKRRKQGEYEIVQTGVVLRSNSPQAP